MNDLIEDSPWEAEPRSFGPRGDSDAKNWSPRAVRAHLSEEDSDDEAIPRHYSRLDELREHRQRT